MFFRFFSVKRTILAALATLVAVVSGCAREGKDEAPADAFKPLSGALLVTIDGPLPAGKIPDGFSASPIRASSMSLLPSAASALTALTPPEHGLRADGVGALRPDAPHIATDLTRQGWRCIAIVSSPALSQTHGLNRGFASYSVLSSATNAPNSFCATPTETINSAIDALQKESAKQKVFLWIHLTLWPRGNISNPDPKALDGLRSLIQCFEPTAPIAIVPLFGRKDTDQFHGLSLDDEAILPEGWFRSCSTLPRAITDIPAAIGASLPSKDERATYTESMIPWHSFRVAPLLRADGVSDKAAAFAGLAPLRQQPLATQAESRTLRLAGFLGEGITPPLNSEAAGSISDRLTASDAELIGRAADAFNAPATNRVESIKSLIADFPGVPLFSQRLGDELFARRDYISACNAYSVAAQEGVNMVYANIMQARCHAAIGNLSAAIEAAERGLYENQNDPAVRAELSALVLRAGEAALASSDIDTARKCAANCRFLEPTSPWPSILEAKVLHASGDNATANAILDRLLLEHSADPRVKAAVAAVRKYQETRK